MSNKIKVLIVDDSAVVRTALTEVLSSDPDIEVIATASDPYIAAHRIKTEMPDVITLDVEMPRMDGITFLHKIMSQHPIPVVICSSLTEKGAETTMKALEYGAVDIVLKPKMGVQQFLNESKILICDAVKGAAMSRVKRVARPSAKSSAKPFVGDVAHSKAAKKLTADVILPKGGETAMADTTEKIIIIGASAGGTEAIKTYLEGMPADTPGTVIVQHMPEKFTSSFAQRLNELCDMEVKEAENGDGIFTGRVLIAPGSYHMLIKRSGARYFVETRKGPLVSRHRPSVDVLFRSAARYVGQNAVGVIMTGMGDDGAAGMLEMKDAGAQTIAQDENSCVVFGMPKEAIDHGGVDRVLPLDQIPAMVMRCARGHKF